MHKSNILLISMMAIAFSSCFKELSEKAGDVDQIEWSPNLALPLANGSFTIAEFADDLSGENFATTTRDDGLVVFVYSEDKVFSTTAEELVNIEDENYSTVLKPADVAIPDFPISGTITQVEAHTFSVITPEGDKLYAVNLKDGIIDIYLSGDFPASGELLITFDAITRGGIPLKTSFEWIYGGTNSQQFERTIDLDGWTIDYSDNGNTFNYFGFTTTLTLNYEGQAISNVNGLEFVLDIKSMEFSQATATIGKRSITSEADQFTLNFIDELKRGKYYFDEPAISFNLTNSFGIPLQIGINSLVAQSEERGDLQLTGNVVDVPQAIDYPSIDEIGESKLTSIYINHENSNLPDILAWQPNTITYDFEGTVNGNGTDDVHFVLDTSRITADVDLELPMIGRFRNLTFSERYDFDGSISDEVESALFRLTTSNGFPINADIQLYFLSESGALIDSLIYDDRRLLAAGLIDENGKVIESTTKEIDVIIQNGRLTSLSQATSLLLRATLNTPQNDTRSVRIFEDDRLSIKLFAQTEFEIIL